jgi:hypothetical protein
MIAMLAACVLTGSAALASPPPADFEAMLARVDSAQLELQNGRAAAFKALWSRGPDITLSGGFGGRIEKGWDAIGPRLDWVATQFSNATHRHERVTSGVSGDLGYVVQLEQIRFVPPGKTDAVERGYRVTMIFRREAGEWKLLHRQADTNLTKTN